MATRQSFTFVVHLRTLVAFVLLAAVIVAPLRADLGDQLFKLTASDTAAGDYFGESVALSGNVALVGAINNDDAGSNSGSAYLFNVATGLQTRKLTASDGEAGDNFGSAVAISADTALVGALWNGSSAAGSAYVFNATTGQQLRKLTAADGVSGDQFGNSLALSGNVAIVGSFQDDLPAVDAGSAYLFNVGTGQQLRKLTAADAARGDTFGRSVAINGNIALVGATGDDDAGIGSGSAYLFNVSTGQQLRKLTASDAGVGDSFGTSVALSANYALVGAGGADMAYLFDITTGQELRMLRGTDTTASDRFGESVALSGNVALIGSFRDSFGSAYLFDVTTGQQLAKLTASDGATDDWLGYAVALSNGKALVGAFQDNSPAADSGSAYLFSATGSLPPLPGDFNHDGSVNAADYVVWRKTDGTPAGFNLWRAHFGQTAGSGSSVNPNAAVPEPATLVMLIVAAVGIRMLRRGIA